MVSLIAIFASLSYIVGIVQVLRRKFSPSIYSRGIWLLLAVNSFASVWMTSKGGTFVLASVFLLGNAGMFLASLRHGTTMFGRIEGFCSIVLIACGVTWLVSDLPLLTLCASLFAHFIGGVPTLGKAWSSSTSESFGFWSLFFIASLLSVVADWHLGWSALMFSMYDTCFDGVMCLLCARGACVSGWKKMSRPRPLKASM
jgi:hypothetical protein